MLLTSNKGKTKGNTTNCSYTYLMEGLYLHCSIQQQSARQKVTILLISKCAPESHIFRVMSVNMIPMSSIKKPTITGYIWNNSPL